MTHGLDTSILFAAELTSHPKHDACRVIVQQIAQSVDYIATAPQVLAEFVHAVTDPRRCASPLTISDALERAERIWTAPKVLQVYPTAIAVSQFFVWMRQYHLGRKRLLDTLLAATYFSAGIRSVVTLNRADFEVFGCFTIVEP